MKKILLIVMTLIFGGVMSVHAQNVNTPVADLDEKVLWKGDTIPMILKSKNFSRYNRGLYDYLFIPKGEWSFGLTAAYGEISAKDLEMFDVINDLDIGASTLSIKPYVQYSVKHNLVAGLRFGYSRTHLNLDSFNMDVTDDMNFNIHDVGYSNHTYSGAVFVRQYIGIERKGRFGVFNELELAFSGGNSDYTRPKKDSEVLRTTHSSNWGAALNYSPGVTAFIMKNVSFNVAMGVFGVNFKTEKQSEEGVETGSRTTSGMSFRLNLFNINFGIGIHL